MRHAHRGAEGSARARPAEGRLTDTRDTGQRTLSGQDAVRGLDLFSWTEQAGRSVAAPAPKNPCTTPADPPPEALAIHLVLASHIGRDSAITAPHIAQAAGLWPALRPSDRGTKVRELITLWYERLQIGMVLVATDDGFFHTTDPADVSRQCRSLRSRAVGLYSRLRRIRLQAQSIGLVYHGHGHWASP